MAGFTGVDDKINEATVNGKAFSFPFFKGPSTAPEAAGIRHSLWTAAGNPGAGAAPATTPGTAYDSNAGTIFFSDVTTDLRFLDSWEAISDVNCTLILYDRLVGVSGISLASTGNKTINSAALPRYSGTAAAGVECWLEVTTATATTAPICSLNQYTNEAGTTGRAGPTLTFPAVATNLDAMIGPMPLQSGDLGIRSIEVGLNVATAASAGIVNVLLLRPLCMLPLVANLSNKQDLFWQFMDNIRLFDSASLALMIQATAVTAVNIRGILKGTWG